MIVVILTSIPNGKTVQATPRLANRLESLKDCLSVRNKVTRTRVTQTRQPKYGPFLPHRAPMAMPSRIQGTMCLPRQSSSVGGLNVAVYFPLKLVVALVGSQAVLPTKSL